MGRFMRINAYMLVVFFLSLLPVVSIFFTPNLYKTHDGMVHLARIAAYYKAISQGEFPVRWASDLNYGYGMPLFNFIYQLPYFFSSFFVFFGFGLVTTFKIVIFISFLLSGVFMFLFAREFFNDEKKALLVAVFYQFTPFHLVELITRGSFGEVYTYTFFPLILFGICRIWKRQNFGNFFLTAISGGLLILSHNALSLVFFSISVVFILFFGSTKKKVYYSIFPLLLSLTLVAFYWIPAIIEHKYTYGDLFMRDMYLAHFPQIKNFFIPNFFNDPTLQIKGISVTFGFFQIVAMLLAIFSLIQKSIKEKKITIFCLSLIAISIFFMQPISKVFWEHMSLLRQFQFPWRFLAVVGFATAVLSQQFFSFRFLRNKYIFWVFISLVVLSTVFYWKPLGFQKINEQDYWNYPLNTTYFGETDVIWSAGSAGSYPKNRVEVIGGKATITDFTKKSHTQTFNVFAETNAQFVDHTQYFPGWRVFVDGKEIPVQFQDQHWRGQLTFFVPKGYHSIVVKFTETAIRLFADSLSLFSLGLLLLICFFRKSIQKTFFL